jgi:hypothetical protein
LPSRQGTQHAENRITRKWFKRRCNVPISLLEKSSPRRQNFAVRSIPAIFWRLRSPQTIESRGLRFGVPAAFEECVTTASASALSSSIGAPPTVPQSSPAANHATGKAFPNLIQMLLGTNDAQAHDSESPATDLAGAPNPALAMAIPQPAPVILPFQLSLLPGLHQTAAASSDKNESDTNTTANDDSLGTFVFPATLPMAFIPSAPSIETASGALTPPRSIAALPEPDNEAGEITSSRKGVVPQDHPEELFTLAPVISDDSLSQPRIQVQATPHTSAPMPVAFEAKLTPVKPPSSTPVISAEATSLRQALAAAPTQDTKSDDGQSDPRRNRADGTKPQVKVSAEKAESVEGSTAAIQTSSVVQGMESASRPGVEPGAAQPGATNQKAAETAPGAPPPVHEPEPVLAKTTVRDLSLRLTSATHEQVDVKVQDKGGELRVAVHSGNSELSADLRQKVGDLVSKLDRSGFQTEITKPSANDTAASAAGKQGDAQNQEFTGRQQQQQSQEQAQQRPRKGRQPQWLQERNTSLDTTGVEGVINR